MEYVFSKRNLLGSNHLFQQTKQKKIKIKSKDAPRKMHSNLIFANEEGVPRGHPQALTLVPLGYFLG
jgi:hypothetical protein